MTRNALVRWATDRRNKNLEARRRARAMSIAGGSVILLALVLPILFFAPDRDWLLPVGLVCLAIGGWMLAAGLTLSDQMPHVPPVEEQIEELLGTGANSLLRGSDAAGRELLRTADERQELLRGR